MMRLSQAQSVAIAGRVVPSSPCSCGSGTFKIEPELSELAPIGLAVKVTCVGCGPFAVFSAAALGLLPSASLDTSVN